MFDDVFLRFVLSASREHHDTDCVNRLADGESGIRHFQDQVLVGGGGNIYESSKVEWMPSAPRVMHMP